MIRAEAVVRTAEAPSRRGVGRTATAVRLQKASLQRRKSSVRPWWVATLGRIAAIRPSRRPDCEDDAKTHQRQTRDASQTSSWHYYSTSATTPSLSPSRPIHPAARGHLPATHPLSLQENQRRFRRPVLDRHAKVAPPDQEDGFWKPNVPCQYQYSLLGYQGFASPSVYCARR